MSSSSSASASFGVRSRPLAYLMLSLAVLFWSGNNLAGRGAASLDIPPLALAFWRWVPVLIVLLPFGARDLWRHRATVRARWKFFLLFGVLAVGMYNALLYIGLRETTAVQASLMTSTVPAIIVLISWAALREHTTRRQLIGAVISVAGAALIVVRGDFAALGSFALNTGDIWIMAAVLTWAGYVVVMRWAPLEIGLIPFQIVATAVGLVFMAPFYAAEIASGITMPITPQTLSIVAYAAVLAGLVGFTIWNAGAALVGPKTAGYFVNLYPVFGAGLAVMILGESLYWYHLAGAIMILGGIFLATVERARGRKQRSSTGDQL